MNVFHNADEKILLFRTKLDRVKFTSFYGFHYENYSFRVQLVPSIPFTFQNFKLYTALLINF